MFLLFLFFFNFHRIDIKLHYRNRNILELECDSCFVACIHRDTTGNYKKKNVNLHIPTRGSDEVN